MLLSVFSVARVIDCSLRYCWALPIRLGEAIDRDAIPPGGFKVAGGQPRGVPFYRAEYIKEKSGFPYGSTFNSPSPFLFHLNC